MFYNVERWELQVLDTYSVDGIEANFNHIKSEVRAIYGMYSETTSDRINSGYAHGFTTAGAFYCSSRYKEFMVPGMRLFRNGVTLNIKSNPVTYSKLGLTYLEVMVEDITEAVDEE